MATAFNISREQPIIKGRIRPEDSLHTSYAETIAAMSEAERVAHDLSAKRYKSVDELIADLDGEEQC